jgi:urocanate hydratase
VVPNQKRVILQDVLPFCAEVNKITQIRHSQGWINEVVEDINELVKESLWPKANKETVSIGYLGNIVDVWEKFDDENIHIDLGSDQTSCTILGWGILPCRSVV